MRNILGQAASYLSTSKLHETQSLLEPLLSNATFVFSQLKQEDDLLSLEIAVMDGTAIHDIVVSSSQLSRGMLALDAIASCEFDSTDDASRLQFRAGSSGLRYRATDPQKRDQLHAFYTEVSHAIQERSGRNTRR